ncbi:MAG TPA: Flp family type IVb pilin [Chloroflexota bacterium]|nr:Flp family type IVb pilin [Chloroflexota bacterium]
MDHVWDRVTALYLRAMNELDEQHGQGLVEYALIIAVVGVMLVGALVALRGGIGNTFSNIQTSLSTNGG